MQDYNYQKGNGETRYNTDDRIERIIERFDTINNAILYLIGKVDNIERIVMKMDGDK